MLRSLKARHPSQNTTTTTTKQPMMIRVDPERESSQELDIRLTRTGDVIGKKVINVTSVIVCTLIINFEACLSRVFSVCLPDRQKKGEK